MASPAVQMSFYETQSLPIINVDTAPLLSEWVSANFKTDFYTEIDSIPESHRPFNHFDFEASEEGEISSAEKVKVLIHDYPKLPFEDPNGGRRIYFKVAKRIFTQLIAEKNTDRKIELLADYYQVSINGHFFLSGNNSIFMGQVNAILESLGFERLQHGVLDYKALLMSTNDFRNEIKKLLKKK